MRRFAISILALAAATAFAANGCSSSDPSARGASGANRDGDDAAHQPDASDPIPEDEGELPEGDAGISGDAAPGDAGRSTDSSPRDTGGAPSTGFISVAVGNGRACRVRAEGTVECWGVNYGELGIPASASCWYFGQVAPPGDLPGPCTPTPTLIPGVNDVAEVAIGSSICARRRDGTVLCWGEIGAGPDECLVYEGLPPDPCTKTPTRVAAVSGAVQIGVGFGNACARRDDATVTCWGAQPATAIAGLSGVVELAVGGAHTCVILTDRTVRCWGSNQYGQLGVVDLGAIQTPTQVPGLTGVRSLAAGAAHTCAVNAGGSVLCFGGNALGQLGDATQTSRSQPTVVAGISASSVFAGYANTCALAVDGQTVCWGDNSWKQFGYESPRCPDADEADERCQFTPRAVPSMSGVRRVALGDSYACYLLAGGELRCMGDVIGLQFGL